jgi:hypothetical protein
VNAQVRDDGERGANAAAALDVRTAVLRPASR